MDVVLEVEGSLHELHVVWEKRCAGLQKLDTVALTALEPGFSHYLSLNARRHRFFASGVVAAGLVACLYCGREP